MPGPRMLALMVLPLLAALVVLLRHRGGVRGTLDVRIGGLPFLWAAGAVRFVQLSRPEWAAPFLEARGRLLPVLAIWGLGVAFTAANLRGRPPWARMALAAFAVGFTLNAVATLANGAMPFSAPAARTAGFSDEAILRDDPLHVAISDRTVLPLLADVIPVPHLQKVISLGDVLMLAGLTALVVALARDGATAERHHCRPTRRSPADPAMAVEPVSDPAIDDRERGGVT